MRVWLIVLLLLLFSGLDLVGRGVGILARSRYRPRPRASPAGLFGPLLFYDTTNA